MYVYYIMAQQMPIELPSLRGFGQTPTTVYLGDLADKILNHIKNEYSSQEINQIATDYSRNPFRIKYDEANDDLLTLQTYDRLPTPGVTLFNMAVKEAMQEHGADVKKNQIILILCEVIPTMFSDVNTSNGEDQVRNRLYACPLCTVAWNEYQQQHPQDGDGANSGGGKKRRRSGLKSHRRIRTRHKSNKKTKHKKRKQKKTKRKKMRRKK